MTRFSLLCGAAAFATLGLAPAVALAAGPCTSDIAQLGKQLGSQNGLGAPVSEPGAGQHVDKNAASQQASAAATPKDKGEPGGASRTGGGSAGTVGGVAGAAGTAAGGGTAAGIASGAIATSPEDVRRQSEGKPTTAAQAATGTPDSSSEKNDKISQAKSALQRAVDLNAKGDKSCMGAIDDARNLMKGS